MNEETVVATPPSEASTSALLDQVEPRSYASGNIAVDPSSLQQPLPEAPIGTASSATEEDIFQQEIDRARQAKAQSNGTAGVAAPKPVSSKTSKNEAPGKDYSNPDLKGLSPEKSKEAAENLAKLLLQGYARLTDFADSQLQVSERKMLKIRSVGKIDMETPIPIEGGVVTFEEFIRTYNQQTRGTLTVEPEFIEDVLPRLTSVLAKRGQGLSDEQYLLGAFGAHVGINAQKFFAQQATLRQFMAFGLEMTRRNREEPVYAPNPAGYGPSSPRPQDQPPPPAPPPPPAAPAPVVHLYEAPPDLSGRPTQDFALPQWGEKEKQKALKKASRVGSKAAAAGRDMTQAPTKRRKIARKKTAS